MTPVSLYYLHFENITIYLSRIKGKNKSLLFNRVPILRHVHSNWAQNVIYKACIVLEPLASLIIVTIKFLPSCFKAVITKRQPLSDELYFDTLQLLKDRIISAGKYEETVDWFYSFDIPENYWDKSKRCHSLFEYVTLWNVIQAYCLSLITIIGAQTKLKFKYIFRTFNSFEFFIAYYTLKNIPIEKTICFCNQSDRWALLYDHAPQRNKILFQHGIENPSANWPIKYKNIDTVYAFSKEEAEILIKTEFEKRPCHIHLLGPTIKLTQMNNDDYFKILIVGFPGYLMFEREKAIVDAFNMEGCTVYLKPHPSKEDMTTYLNLEKEYTHCKIILEKLFPDVDIVVSYRSTLAVEYQAYNKRVMMYNDYTIEEMIREITKIKNES